MNFDWRGNSAKRIYTGLGIILALAVAFAFRLLTVWIFDAIMLVLACVAVWEVLRAKTNPYIQDTKNLPAAKKEQLKRNTPTALNGIALVYLIPYIVVAYTIYAIGIATNFAIWLHFLMQIIVLGIFALYTMIMNYMDKEFTKECTAKKEDLLKTSAKSAWEFVKIVVYPFLLLFSLISLNHMGARATALPFEGATDTVTVPMVATFALLLVFVTSWFSDTFAYFTGKVLKGPKLLPQKFNYISPNKTITGFIGALFGGIVGALVTILILVQDGSMIQAFFTDKIGNNIQVQLVFIAIGLCSAIVTHAGDLYASWLKRKCGIKDFGNYLPGHGGAMDRLDGITFNALFIWFTFMIMVA